MLTESTVDKTSRGQRIGDRSLCHEGRRGEKEVGIRVSIVESVQSASQEGVARGSVQDRGAREKGKNESSNLSKNQLSLGAQMEIVFVQKWFVNMP
jgi:hypothetical protein